MKIASNATPASLSAFISALSIIFLSGCTSQQNLYHWDGYEAQVYDYFKGGDYSAQAAELEKGVQQARSVDKSLPPGYHAHLGLLYLQTGDYTKMADEFSNEKALYPEATAYMDFLLSSKKSSSDSGATKRSTKSATSDRSQHPADSSNNK